MIALRFGTVRYLDQTRRIAFSGRGFGRIQPVRIDHVPDDGDPRRARRERLHLRDEARVNAVEVKAARSCHGGGSDWMNRKPNSAEKGKHKYILNIRAGGGLVQKLKGDTRGEEDGAERRRDRQEQRKHHRPVELMSRPITGLRINRTVTVEALCGFLEREC
jgi:hypothetical protein